MTGSVLRATAGPERALSPRDLAVMRPVVPRPPRRRAERRDPGERSRTYFCSNPQCGHATWAPAEQAVHMAREFAAAAQALVRRAPGSPEALRLTGGVVLADLPDADCRAAAAAYQRLRRRSAGAENGRPAGEMTLPVYLAYLEYSRRVHAGILPPAGSRAARVPRDHCPRCRSPWDEQHTYVHTDGVRRCLACRRTADAAAARRRRRAVPGSAMAVREWVLARGLEVPAHGPVPRWARIAYEAALAGAADGGDSGC